MTTDAILVLAGQLDSLIQLIQEVDSLIVADALTVIPSDRADWIGYARELVDSIQELSEVVDSLCLLEIEALIETNDEITVTTRQEKNQRLVNKLYLDMLAKGSFTFSESEQDSLEFIAEQCPQIGGRAVFVARAMRAYFSDATYVETEPCDDSIPMLVAPPRTNRVLVQESLKPQQQKEQHGVRVFPNPAEDYVMITHNFEQATQLFLYDAYGKVRKTMTLSRDSRANRLSTADLIPGIYLVSLVADNAETVNIRLLIVR